MRNIKICTLLLGGFLLCASACGGGGASLSPDSSPSPGGQKVNCEVAGVEFGVSEISDVDAYAAEVTDGAVSHDAPLQNGMIVSPYYTLTVGGKEVPVYATRCAKSVHSFAYADISKTDKTKDFEVEVRLTARLSCTALSKSKPSVAVLPQKRGVEAEISGDTVTARISDFGSFTFAFNKKGEEALTLYLAEAEEFSAPEGWTVERLSAKKHTMAETTFKNADTVYYFEKGRHLVDSVSMPSDAWVYLEAGAYLEAYADGEGKYSPVFRTNGTQNVKLYGHGAVDFSACMGGDSIQKGAFDFHGAKNIAVDGILSVNSNTWTLCFTDCENVNVSRSLLFGYRTYSDGIMLSDCRDSLVTKCFVRTGDDAMETKSTSSQGYTDNVTFRDNDCWTDKGLGYGVVWETNHDVKNVTFIDCSVGFAQSDWDERLGALAVQLGDHYNTVKNIRFENIEIYRCYSPAVINCELKQSGKLIDEIYIKDVHCSYAVGYLLRLAEVNLENAAARFGTFYLDNLSKNGVALTQETRDDEYMLKFVVRADWNAEKYVKINTLGGED